MSQLKRVCLSTLLQTLMSCPQDHLGLPLAEYLVAQQSASLNGTIDLSPCIAAASAAALFKGRDVSAWHDEQIVSSLFPF